MGGRSQNCPECGRRIRRYKYDKFLKCHRCGWVVSYPILRWLVHPSWTKWLVWKVRNQSPALFRHGLKTLLVAGLATVILLGVLTAGILPLERTDNSGSPEIGVSNGLTNTSDTVEDVTESGSQTFEPLNQTQTERLVHRYVNSERSTRGLTNLSYDEELASIAQYHSNDMKRRGYFAHKGPRGETMADRYDKFGYDCRVSTGANRYMAGAENIWNQFGTLTYGSEKKLASKIVESWMNSQGHRENILMSEWRNEGIGVNITTSGGETHIYASQNFC